MSTSLAAKPGESKRGRHTVWTGEQLGRFLAFAVDSAYLPAWLFLATSGSRWGEVLGLTWDDVDLDAATAIMLRQVTMVDHRVVVKERPNTKACHTIPLDPGTLAMLRCHRERQTELKRVLGPATRTTAGASAGRTPPTASQPGSSGADVPYGAAAASTESTTLRHFVAFLNRLAK